MLCKKVFHSTAVSIDPQSYLSYPSYTYYNIGTYVGINDSLITRQITDNKWRQLRFKKAAIMNGGSFRRLDSTRPLLLVHRPWAFHSRLEIVSETCTDRHYVPIMYLQCKRYGVDRFILILQTCFSLFHRVYMVYLQAPINPVVWKFCILFSILFSNRRVLEL